MAGIRSVLLCLVAIVVCSSTIVTKRSYKGYHVERVNLNGDADWRALETILSNVSLQLELWSAPTSSHDFVDIQVAPPYYEYFVAALNKRRIRHKIFMEDIERMIEVESASERYELLKDNKLSHRERRSPTARVSNKVVGTYAPLSEIETWMKMLAKHNSDIVKLESIGKTHEGRDIYVIKLGKAVKGYKKPGLYLDGAMHAREWIAPATVVYIIYQLLSQYMLGDEEVTEYMDLVDWHFVPVANPDGYAYTHEKERLWRKNRAPNVNNTCVGTDLNRNWPYHWGHVTPYTSENPCSIVYLGPAPGSERETQALMTYLLRHNDSIRAFISHHSYTQKWFTRWGYTNATPPDYLQSLRVAEKAVTALEQAGGEPYNVGRPFELLYAYTGGSADWAKGVAGIKYSYTVELRDRGRYGFLLPANYVVPVGDELWAAVKVVASQLINETYINSEEGTYTPADDTTTSTEDVKPTLKYSKSTQKTTTEPWDGFPFGPVSGAMTLVRFTSWDKLLMVGFLCWIWTIFAPS